MPTGQGYPDAVAAFRKRAEGRDLPNPQGSGQPLPPDASQQVLSQRAGQSAGAPTEKPPEEENITAALIQRLKFLSQKESQTRSESTPAASPTVGR